MNVARVTEISAQSATSFDDADQNVDMENNEIKAYRVNMQVTFLLDD